MKYILSFFSMVCFLSFSLKAQSNDVDALIQELQAETLESFGPETFGAAYAALINFAGNPDVGTANYTVKGGDDTSADIQTYRITGRKQFDAPREGDKVFLQLIVPLQSYETGYAFDEENRLDTEYVAGGILISGGWIFSLSEQWSFTPIINTGLVALQNKTDYTGEFSQQVLEPVYSGTLLDWDAESWVFGGSLQLDYENTWGGLLWRGHTSITHNTIKSYDTSSDLKGFSSSANTFRLFGEMVVPTHHAVFEVPLAIVVTAGTTQFFGPDRDVLGFDQFYDAGLALEFDITGWGYQVHSLRLGGRAIYGENIEGWSFIFSYGF